MVSTTLKNDQRLRTSRDYEGRDPVHFEDCAIRGKGFFYRYIGDIFFPGDPDLLRGAVKDGCARGDEGR